MWLWAGQLTTGDGFFAINYLLGFAGSQRRCWLRRARLRLHGATVGLGRLFPDLTSGKLSLATACN